MGRTISIAANLQTEIFIKKIKKFWLYMKIYQKIGFCGPLNF
jgi:hypothetical protein